MEPDDETLDPCSPFPPDQPDGTARAIPVEWRSEAVVGLARGIVEEQAFERLPILADALEEAGCTDTVLLRHCRESMTHCAGCWAVNLALDQMPEVEPDPPPRSLHEPPSDRHRHFTPEQAPQAWPSNWRQRITALVILLTVVVIMKARPSRESPVEVTPVFVEPLANPLADPQPGTAAEILVKSIGNRKVISLKDK